MNLHEYEENDNHKNDIIADVSPKILVHSQLRLWNTSRPWVCVSWARSAIEELTRPWNRLLQQVFNCQIVKEREYKVQYQAWIINSNAAQPVPL